MPLASTPGGDIHYARTGTGPALVLLLPQSAGPVGVGPFVEGLARSFSVIRYDQRGTGKSPAPADPAAVTMQHRAGEVADLLQALGVLKAHVFCHSTGCGIGIALTGAYPDRVDRLVLTTPWAYADAHLSTMQNLRIASARTLSAENYARFNASLLFSPAYRREHEAGFAEQVANAPTQDADQIATRLHAILAFDTRPITPRIQNRTLVVSSDDDQLMPAWFGRDIATGMPHSDYVELRGGGHMLLETQSAALLDHVVAFLSNE